MPLGIDQSHYLKEKVKKQDKRIREKDERITMLETENAMLLLKLAQLQGEVRTQRQDLGEVENKYEAEQKYRQGIAATAMRLKEEIKSVKKDLTSVHTFVREMPQEFKTQLNNANMVIERHRQLFHSQTSSLSALEKQMFELQAALQDISDRHAKEKQKRQELHNTLMELRGNIRVHTRVRPLMEFDCGSEDATTLGRPGSKSEVIVHHIDDENVCVRTAKQNKLFEFERVYSSQDGQDAVFDEVQPMLTSLLDGYNICIMAYGQTGSGKTHTMLGSHKNDDYYDLTSDPHPNIGVIPRATRELFRLIGEKPDVQYKIQVSVVEIYNNEIKDLLSGDPNMKHDVITAADGSLSMPTITQKSVDTVYDVMCLVQHGLRTRRESATLVHEHSSRSHLIVTLTVSFEDPTFFSKAQQQQAASSQIPVNYAAKDRRSNKSLSAPSPTFGLETSTVQPSLVKTKLQLVDLAGSECVGMSGVKGVGLREASNINKSLSALSDVLGALDEHRSHVPYRNSRLTHVLQDSIGGDAKLLVLLCVSPAQRYMTESLQSLGFGQRARQVQRGQIKRRFPSSVEKVGSESARKTSASSIRMQ